MGVSAQLADARAKLKDAAPPDRWDAVMDEVSRVQVDQSASLLQAMHIVLRKLAGGSTRSVVPEPDGQSRDMTGCLRAHIRNAAACCRSGMSLPTSDRSRSLLQTARRPIVQATFSAGGRSRSKTSLAISFLPSVAAEYFEHRQEPLGLDDAEHLGEQRLLVERGEADPSCRR